MTFNINAEHSTLGRSKVCSGILEGPQRDLFLVAVIDDEFRMKGGMLLIFAFW